MKSYTGYFGEGDDAHIAVESTVLADAIARTMKEAVNAREGYWEALCGHISVCCGTVKYYNMPESLEEGGVK